MNASKERSRIEEDKRPPREVWPEMVKTFHEMFVVGYLAA